MKSALLLPVLAFAIAARAESPDSIPDPQKRVGSSIHSSIYDGARVLNDAQKHRIDDAINAFEKKTGALMAVVTVQTLDGMTIQEWSNTAFRHLGVGHKGKDDGALFVFAIKDRKSWIEVGPGLQDRLTDARVAAITREQIRPAFRKGQYGAGILEGVRVAANYVEGGGRPTPAPQSKPSSGSSSSNENGGYSPNGNSYPSNGGAPWSGSYPSNGSYPGTSYPSGGGGGGGGLLLLGILAVGGIGGLMYLGSRPRKCPNCQTEMRQSEALAKDLSPANQCEQAIGSRHFVRCSCPKCGFSEIEPRNNPFSGFTTCDACGHLTAQRQSFVVQQPTFMFSGLEETTETCLFPPCRHISRRQRTLPRLQRSSSSGVIIGGALGGFSGGFGGGSSDSGSSGGGGYDGGSSGSFGGGDSDGGGGGSDW